MPLLLSSTTFHMNHFLRRIDKLITCDIVTDVNNYRRDAVLATCILWLCPSITSRSSVETARRIELVLAYSPHSDFLALY